MKKIIFIFLAYVLLVGISCKDRTAIDELDAFKSNQEVEEQNKKVVLQLFTAIDNVNLVEVKKLLADDLVLNTPSSKESWGVEMLLQAIKPHFVSFPDWTHVIEDVITEGDKVVVRATQKGTHKGEYKGIPATDIEVLMPAVSILMIKDGKIKKWWVIEDHIGLYTQLGMELQMKETNE